MCVCVCVYVCVCVGKHHHPFGNFTVLFDGEGQINVEFECGNFEIKSSPYVLVCPKPTFDGGGLQVGIAASTKGNHIRNIRFISPDMQGGETYTSSYDTQPFTPPYIDSIGKYKCLRFMDWSATNGQNIAEWADRTTPTDFSQSRSRSRSAAVTSITDMSTAGGDELFSMTKWAAKVVTATAHGFSTGQTVSFGGTNASVVMEHSATCTHGPYSFDGGLEGPLVHVLDDTTFLVQYGVRYDPCFAQSANLSKFTGSKAGTVTVTVDSGASLELAAQMVAPPLPPRALSL